MTASVPAQFDAQDYPYIRITDFITVSKLKGNSVVLAEHRPTGKFYVLKKKSEDHRIGLILRMQARYKELAPNFKSLVIPNIVGHTGDFDVIEYIEGTSLQWTESFGDPGFGGDGISPDYIKYVLDISEELEILGYWNGDFYWRNFIFLENGRVALVDWDRILISKNSQSSRGSYLFCLCFANENLRNHLASELKRRGHITKRTFQKKAISGTSNFMAKWKRHPMNVKRLEELHDKLLDDDWYERFWKSLDKI